MEDTPLEELLSRILSPDNVFRAAAESELERRSNVVPGFCAALADYCDSIACASGRRAVALVAFSVLKRNLSKASCAQEVQHVVLLFLSHLSNVAVATELTMATLHQWCAVVVTGVRRLAALRAPSCAAQQPDAAAATACFEAVSDLVISQVLNAMAQWSQADAASLSIVCSHVCLLQSFYEGAVSEAVQVWLAELMASCAPPMLGMLCALSKATRATQTSSPCDAWRRQCALLSLVAHTLCVMYEWRFTAFSHGKFPTDLKRGFLVAFPSLLQAGLFTSCAQWACLAASASSLDNTTGLRAALCVAAPSIAAFLATLEFVAKVLQYGGWHKSCVTAEVMQQLLSSLEADVASYQTALTMEDSDAVDGGFGNAGPSGTLVDCWLDVGGGDSNTQHDATPETAFLVRCHVTQRWMLFCNIAFLPFLQRALIDIVGDRCGQRYYEVLLSYAVLTPAEAHAWLDDPNVLLREEDERGSDVRWTTRETVAQLYTDSISALGPLFLHASLESINERLFAEGHAAEAVAAGDAGDAGAPISTTYQNAPLQREACLFFLEMALRRCSKNLRQCGSVDFMPLATHIWDYDVAGPTAHYATAARALLLLTAVVKFSCASSQKSCTPVGPARSPSLGAFLATTVASSATVLAEFAASAAVHARPSSSSCSLLTAVMLCQFLQNTLSYWPSTVLEQHFAALQDSLLLLLSPQVGLTAEVLYTTLELLTDFLRAAQHAVRTTRHRSGDPGRDSILSERLPGVVMDCWRRHVSDPSFADVVLQLFRRVVRDDSGVGGGGGHSPALAQLLHELAWVHNVLCGYADSMAEVCAVPYFLLLLRTIFAHAPDDFANGAATLMLDSLCQLLLCTAESAILVASGSCLAALLRRCPAAQSVQVHVVAASVEAALRGGVGGVGGAGESRSDAGTALIADAPRVVFPFSTVIVAIVLRILDDHSGEASLLEVGQTLVTIMRQSASFSQADLLRVIHSIVHRLGVVRTDTVTQQLLAPLATLLLLHPAALLRTLVQGGLLAETMGHWLPRVEHFTNLSVTYSSCEGLLGLLRLLSDPSQASVTAEEGQRIAQQPVLCSWKLPVDVVGNASSAAKATAAHKAKRAEGKKAKGSSMSSATHATLASALAGGAVVETRLPLYAAVLVAVGRGLLRLLATPLPALRRASQPNRDGGDEAFSSSSSCSDGDGDGGSGGGRRLFRESSSSSDGDDEESWEEEEVVDTFGDPDDGDDEGNSASSSAAVAAAAQEDGAVASPSEGLAMNEKAEKERLLAAMGVQLVPWMQRYGGEVTAYFTVEETRLLMAFFASAVASGNTAA